MNVDHRTAARRSTVGRIAFLLPLLVILVVKAPSSALCHGFLPDIVYNYHYETSLILNNNDNREPAGFQLDASVSFQNVWQQTDSYLAVVRLSRVQFHPRNDRSFRSSPVIDNWPPILANIDQNGNVRTLFVEKHDDNKPTTSAGRHIIQPTHLNLVVGILNALRNRQDPDQKTPFQWNQNGRHIVRSTDHHETSSKFSLLAPMITDHWEMVSELAPDHDVSISVSGWQNVTLKSKIYPSGHSKLYARFSLKLSDERRSSLDKELSKAQTVSQAVYLFGVSQSKKMVSLGPEHFKAERRPCQPFLCDSLPDFLKKYQQSLAEDHSLATNSLSVGYLKLLGYLRTNSGHLTKKDILKLLQKYDKTREKDGNVLSTVLDTIAGSRHGDAMLAAFDFLNLPKCQGEDRVWDCERFLVTLAISGSTVANMGSSHLAEHSLSVEQLLDLMVPLLADKSTTGSSGKKWADDRVRHSFALTIGTLLHAYRVYTRSWYNPDADHVEYIDSSSHREKLRHHSSPVWAVDVTADDPDENFKPKTDESLGHHEQKLALISEKIVKNLQHELDACKDPQCRIVYLYALGGTRIISKYGVLMTLKRYALTGGKRESVAAMKALKDGVQFEWEEMKNNEKIVTRLRQLLLRILYDSSLETTSRLMAAELLANHIDPEGDITIELVQHLDQFPSELATMIWKRAVTTVLNRRRSSDGVKNWHLHSKILSGNSASFRYVMGGTGHANASYGVFLEMLKAKLPKETSFNVDISQENVTQDIVTVGVFARGLHSLAGADGDGDDSGNDVVGNDEEATLAGATLQILGNQIRPFLFFQSTSELMGHVWSGTGSEPTSVFRGNFLMADYLDVKPLINGMLVEQSLRAIFSLDLSGQIQISLWNRNSHSEVETKGAMLFQGAQEVYTSDLRTSARKLFSFGAEASLNFITDYDFYSTPNRICIQITQPEFIFRHNTRKYEQVNSDDLHRRIHRRQYRIPARSYVLNRDNSEMCAVMMGDGSGGDSGGGNTMEFEI